MLALLNSLLKISLCGRTPGVLPLAEPLLEFAGAHSNLQLLLTLLITFSIFAVIPLKRQRFDWKI